MKKLLILYLPYILIGLMATKLGEAWRFSPGADIGEKLRNIMTGAGRAFQSPLPSFQPLDLLLGILLRRAGAHVCCHQGKERKEIPQER